MTERFLNSIEPNLSSSYEDAVNWLFKQAPNYQIDGKKAYKPGLDNIQKLCEYFGNPQDKLKHVHIGGTNGKGSTSNMLASVLQEAGYKVGLYNSPHLTDFTERIKVNGQNANKNFVLSFIEKLRAVPSEIRPSFFEYTTIMAFSYFAAEKVDIAIIEVGLGGRLDSTNIISPLVSAITNVSLDHMNILGNTIEEIAVQKAGIIKSNTPIILGDSNPKVKSIVQAEALKRDAPFIDATVLETDLKSDLKGDYQAKNIKVVMGLVAELRNKGFEISFDSLKEGLAHVVKNTNFMGRWHVVSKDPLIICDTAHNQAGLEVVFSQLSNMPMRKHIVLGFVKDKKIEEVLTLLPKSEQYYFVKPSINRGRDPKDYENILRESKLYYLLFDSVDAGFKAAKEAMQSDEMIFIGGSNFVIGDFFEKNL